MSAAPDRLLKWAAAGLSIVQIGLVNAAGVVIGDGLPDAGAAAGLMNFKGVTGFTADVPDPVTHDVIGRSGRDKWSFQFAPEGNPSVTITSKMMDMGLRDAMGGLKTQDIGQMKLSLAATNLDGLEPQVCALLSELASSGDDADFGTDLWVHMLVPLVKFNNKPFSLNSGAQESEYAFVGKTNQAAKLPWGAALTEDANGATKAAVGFIASEYAISIDTFRGSGSADSFVLQYTPAGDETEDRVHAFLASTGADVAISDVDVATKTVTFTTAPAEDALVVVLYETADGAIS
jgi:hypothetical protein